MIAKTKMILLLVVFVIRKEINEEIRKGFKIVIVI
jgi:hypothetical protein